MFPLRIAALVFLAALAGLSQTRPAAKPAPQKPVARNTQPAAPSGIELENAIRGRFAKSKIASDGFQVRVQGRTATIEGHTDVIQHKGVATRLARSAGASQVVNRIQISESARRKASAHLASGRRRAQLKRGEARSEQAPQR